MTHQFHPDRPNGAADGQMPFRKIVHLDMDAFYASVEQRDAPALRDRPIAVLDPKGWGIVATVSYQARALGLRAGGSVKRAKAEFPGVFFVEARPAAYQEASDAALAIYRRYTDLIEPIFLDEAYLDVTRSPFSSATAIAKEVRAAVLSELGLVVTAGVSYNKLLAKLASDSAKPDGLLVIPPSRGETFAGAVNVECFHGIGPATTARLNANGIYTGKDLRQCSLTWLTHQFGKTGATLFNLSRGIDHRPVRASSTPQSFGSEVSLRLAASSEEEKMQALASVARQTWTKLKKSGRGARTITLKVRTPDFRTTSRRVTLKSPLEGEDHLLTVVSTLLQELLPGGAKMRLVGVAVGDLVGIEDAVLPNQISLPI